MGAADRRGIFRGPSEIVIAPVLVGAAAGSLPGVLSKAVGIERAGHDRVGVRMARASGLVITLLLLAMRTMSGNTPGADPFAFFSPSVRITQGERTRLNNGDVVVRILPADDGHLAVFAATRIGATPSALIHSTRRIETLKRGPLVLGVGRFGTVPSSTDLDNLSLDAADADALRRCRPGDCALKLSADEIESIRAAIARGGAGWRHSAEDAFRAALVDRVRGHQHSGLLALPPYADKDRPFSVGEAFSSIVARSPYLTRAFPDAVNTLQTPLRGTESDQAFYYWSRERYGSGRTVITVTYVRLLEAPTAPQAMTISTQLFASHYVNGAVGLTAIACGRGDGDCYLAYLNRTHTDMLGGIFGGLKRALIEERLARDTPAVLRMITQRIESGET
jgi:hypothetical protein